MGCFGSREDARRKVFEQDWVGCDYGFIVGSVTGVTGFCPLDKLTINFLGAEKEIAEQIGEFNEQKLEEVKAEDLGKKVFEALKELHKTLSEKYKDGSTAGEVMGKYSGTEAIKQIDECLSTFCKKYGGDFKWPDEPVAEAKEGDMAMMEEMAMMEGKMEGEMEMEAAGDAAEGGEEMMMEMEGEKPAEMMEGEMMEGAKEGAPAATFDPASFEEVSGKVDLPKLLLQLMVQYPAFGDAVKAQIMHHDLGGDAPFNSFGPVAALSGAYVKAKLGDEADSWGCAWLTGDDLDDLKDAHKDNGSKALIFPGVVKAYAKDSLALGEAGEGKGKDAQVLFKFNGKVFKPAGDNLHVFFRQFAKVDKLTEPAGDVKHWVCELSDFTKYAFATVKEYHAAIESAVKTGKEVVDAAKGEEAPKEENKEGEMMMDEPKMEMEGEMMMEEPPKMDE